jgi:hypothetical protein
MEPSVKAAMLKSSQVLVPGPAPASTRGLRRVQSGSSLNIESLRNGAISDPFFSPSTPGDKSAAQAVQGATAAALHSRGVSVDVPRSKSRTGFTDLKDGKGAPQKTLSPVQFVSVLTGKSSLELEVEVVKKLCLLLRNEAAR